MHFHFDGLATVAAQLHGRVRVVVWGASNPVRQFQLNQLSCGLCISPPRSVEPLVQINLCPVPQYSVVARAYAMSTRYSYRQKRNLHLEPRMCTHKHLALAVTPLPLASDCRRHILTAAQVKFSFSKGRLTWTARPYESGAEKRSGTEGLGTCVSLRFLEA